MCVKKKVCDGWRHCEHKLCPFPHAGSPNWPHLFMLVRRTLLLWGAYTVFTGVYTNVHICLHRCFRQQTFLSHGCSDLKFSVQGWQVGIWFLVCKVTMSLCSHQQ